MGKRTDFVFSSDLAIAVGIIVHDKPELARSGRMPGGDIIYVPIKYQIGKAFVIGRNGLYTRKMHQLFTTGMKVILRKLFLVIIEHRHEQSDM